MRCVSCGGLLDGGSRFCNFCGAPAAPPPAQSPPAATRSGSTVAVAAGLLLGLAAGGGGWWLYKNRPALPGQKAPARQAGTLSLTGSAAPPGTPPSEPVVVPEAVGGLSGLPPPAAPPIAPPVPPADPNRPPVAKGHPPRPPAGGGTAEVRVVDPSSRPPVPVVAAPASGQVMVQPVPPGSPGGTPQDPQQAEFLARVREEMAKGQQTNTAVTVVTPPPKPAGYAGPPSGILVWTGTLGRDQSVTIDGSQASAGRLDGALPGVPVMLELNQRDYALAEVPSPSNNWTRLAIRSRRSGPTTITIHWTVLK